MNAIVIRPHIGFSYLLTNINLVIITIDELVGIG